MNDSKWLKFWISYIIAFVGLGFIAVVVAEKIGEVPLRFTKSISYDIKIKFIRDHLPTSQYDTFVVGSSMALNNIDSSVLEQAGVASNVLNLSSWGLGTSESLQLLQMLDLSGAQKVVYASQYFDYVGEVDKVLDEPELRRYLNGRPVLKTYFQNISRLPSSLWDHWDLDNLYGNSRTLRYLGFDSSGDVNYDRRGFLIDKRKWTEIPQVPDVPVGDEYFKHLLAMHEFLKAHDIQLFVVTSPFRDTLLERDDNFREFFAAHRAYLAGLAGKYGFTYIDAHAQLNFNDDYFVDASHLHSGGAKLVTRLIVKQVQAEQVSGVLDL